jgi:hypothetical protein
MTVKSGTSPHRGQSRDTIYTLVYEGLEINMYHSFINDREMKYSVTISGEHYEMISGIKVGTAKGYIVGILGVPSRISATVLIYVCTGCDSGGEETLRFFLKDDVVEKIEIHYSID